MVIDVESEQRAKVLELGGAEIAMPQCSDRPQPAASSAPSSEAENPLVSVIIPHYNDMENLRNCMTLFTKQTFPTANYEIVVADNNSKCGLEAVQALCGSQARVVPAPIQGAAEARNAAVRASRGRILAFIDSDCRPDPRWLEEGVKALDHADVIGGRVDVDYDDPASPTGVEAFEKVFAFDFKKYVEKDRYSGSGNMFVLRSNFDAVGGFRPGVSEDRDWGNRAVDAGLNLKYADSVVVSHPARKNWQELQGKWKRIISETYLFRASRGGGNVQWVLFCAQVFVSPFVHVFKIIRSDKVKSLQLKLSAIVVMFRIRWYRSFYGLKLLSSGKAIP